MESTKDDIASDLLKGGGAIAEFVFGDKNERRRVYQLAEMGDLPLFRLGNIVCGRKSTIRRHLAEQEALHLKKAG